MVPIGVSNVILLLTVFYNFGSTCTHSSSENSTKNMYGGKHDQTVHTLNFKEIEVKQSTLIKMESTARSPFISMEESKRSTTYEQHSSTLRKLGQQMSKLLTERNQLLLLDNFTSTANPKQTIYKTETFTSNKYEKLQDNLTSQTIAKLRTTEYYKQTKQNKKIESNTTSTSASKMKTSTQGSEPQFQNEYPGDNSTARVLILNQWKVYYRCLQQQSVFIPQVYYVFPGGSIKLECNACLEPGGAVMIHWNRATIRTNNRVEKVAPLKISQSFGRSNRISIAEDGLTLSIFNVQEKDAGNYTCFKHQTLMSVYLVQVASKLENISKVWSKRAPGKPQAAPPITLASLGITVFTKWTNWTSCSRCGSAGKRIKFGACTVGMTRKFRTSGQNIFAVFKYGLPCRSSLLPSSINAHPNIAQRHSEVMEAFCKEPCPKKGKYIVKNRKGDVVEEADNDSGIYSTFQKLPQLPVPVQRRIIFMDQWETAQLQCPGTQHNDAPVRWFRGSEPIFGADERIFVSTTHTLIIMDLGISDSLLYSCWQRGRLVGTIRLHVSAPLRLSFSQQFGVLLMLLIMTSFVVIFARVMYHSLQDTHHPKK